MGRWQWVGGGAEQNKTWLRHAASGKLPQSWSGNEERFFYLFFYRHSFGCLILFAGYSDLLQRDGGGVKLDSEFIFPSRRGGFPLDELPQVKT